jgi:uncharacterized protein YigA (DUF484 family)
MSTQPKPDFVDDSLSEEAVRDYLLAHPDFFERNARLLGSLRLPHESGSAVSLVERQVSVLRQKEIRLEQKLKELIGVARDNDLLAAKIHHFALQLVASEDLAGTITAIEEAMRSGFDADHAVLVLFGNPDEFEDIDAGRFFRALPREDESLGSFATFLGGSGPRCGQVRDAQRDFLFRDAADEVGSVALVPLGQKASIGFLAIGSVDGDRFHPGMSIDFLTRIGDLVSAALRRFGRGRGRLDRSLRPASRLRAPAVEGNLQALPSRPRRARRLVHGIGAGSMGGSGQ